MTAPESVLYWIYKAQEMIVKQRSIQAKALADRKYRQRIVVARKGAGSYNRKRIKQEQADVRQGS